jgi:hypothetical protein
MLMTALPFGRLVTWMFNPLLLLLLLLHPWTLRAASRRSRDSLDAVVAAAVGVPHCRIWVLVRAAGESGGRRAGGGAGTQCAWSTLTLLEPGTG